MKAGTKFRTVDEYISSFSKPVQAVLSQVRSAIREAAPAAEEVISYNMPSFRLSGMLVYYAAYKNHIGFYPTPSGIEAFKKELAGYEGAKGSVQFPIDEPMPLALIKKIVKFRVKENLDQPDIKRRQKKRISWHRKVNEKFVRKVTATIKAVIVQPAPYVRPKKKPQSGFLSRLSAPARRALENTGIKTLNELSKYTEAEILKLHGMGPSSIPKLRVALKDQNLEFQS